MGEERGLRRAELRELWSGQIEGRFIRRGQRSSEGEATTNYILGAMDVILETEVRKKHTPSSSYRIHPFPLPSRGTYVPIPVIDCYVFLSSSPAPP